MGCHKKDHDHFKGECVCDVVEFINDIQDAVDDDNCGTDCLNPVLGANTDKKKLRANTRPFVLFTDEGKPFEAFFNSYGHKFCKSIFFRVESVNDCCAVLRVLRPERTEDFEDDYNHKKCKEDKIECEVFGGLELERTNNCITVDLRCFCAIQCLTDRHIEGV